MAEATSRPTPPKTLEPEMLRKMDRYWRACNYLSAGMIYLRDNPLLREPLKPEHIKNRLLGHWGSDPGQSFLLVHLNRLIKKLDLNVIYIAGPGHGAPATLAHCYLEGHYSEIYPDRSEDEAGMRRFFRQFSFPGGIGSHCTPETPGSIHEGGELGYSLSHGYGAAFDNPDLIVTVMIGDGEAETGPLATSWHSNKFLNPIRDGAVLPVLHLNGYKIANPTILARIPREELEALLTGYGHKPYFVEGDDPDTMHQQMAATLEQCVGEIRAIQQHAREANDATRPRWPMIVLRSPKGWTGPKEVDGHQVEGSWRAHQVPVLDPVTNSKSLKLVESWLRSYEPESLFDKAGRLVEELRELAPEGTRRISANPHANGGMLCKTLDLPAFCDYAVAVKKPAGSYTSPTEVLGTFLRDVMRNNMTNFRVFGPDETASNKLTAIYEVSEKTWLAETMASDADGGELSVDGRVMEMLSEHTLEGWFEGYVLTGRHGLFATYEAFVHVIDSMFNQHAKWLEKAKRDLGWRQPVPSINLLITSLVWRQDHNGFTHQDPGFLDVVTNKSPDVVRIYLPPDANCLLSVADHCLRSRDYVNVIVADKQPHLQYLDMDSAVTHCTKGIGIWDWASTDQGVEPDVVMACAGDIATMEALAAVQILKERFPELKIRFVNVVDLFRLMPEHAHPHGLSDRDFDSLFTTSTPVIFNFHSYASLVHKLTYNRTNHGNLHVHGYHEKGNINTPLELAIINQVDRFSLAIDVIDRVPALRGVGDHAKEWLRGQIIEHLAYAHAEGIDKEEIRNWTWKG
ncbi:phosphoketolase family protein [Paraburkholderia sp. SEWSISQ10-3 4]|uniref:phosphoketolase family protein n=1 Tax=Paraburkholderia TaxID=1822464 RepID=UPI00224E610E|nr:MULTISPECIES: phosphoketolase family protein [Paraburkholderia]MCX4142460.1 phosphoketolase family protein [Paraburkholderia aspalathi]MDN7175140.1 phosphoketolase family protein [Paraburkholderia sp. SEWSISQ10-3 4]MDQ6504781.1 phosphoketolase family protein [Paraburkholderia aspalathi]